MAKKKKQKKEEKKSFPYTNELVGIFSVILSLIGLGGYGKVGRLILKFAIFMFGSWWFLFLVLILGLGLYMVIKRGKVNYFTARLIGIYALVTVILLLSHVKYISSNELACSDIISTTYSNIQTSYTQIDSDATSSNVNFVFYSPVGVKNTGGGICGGLLSALLVYLFDVAGTYIVVFIFAVFGLIMIFDINLFDLFKSIINFFKNLFTNNSDEDYEEEGVINVNELAPKEEKEDKRVVITSVEDITHSKEEKEATKEDKSLEFVENDEPGKYVKPPITLLDQNKNKNNKANSNEIIAQNTKALEGVFADFDIKAKVIEVHVGPAVTQYEMELVKGTRVNKVLGISREIALALAAKEVRIEAPIPGKTTIGVEIPNQNIIPVSMREIMESKVVTSNPNSKLLAPLGRDIMGNVKCVEINKTPHMLVAGATGSGKSVCINNIILSIIMRTTPDEVKMVLVDPKKVEFNVYDGIPHLLIPVVTDPKKASVALQKIVVEMDDRYEIFKNSGTKNIQTYNEYVEKELKKNPGCGLHKMPFILVIIDELADLMLVAAKEVEESIMRITQLARAAGIHLIVATQRPSTDVITGVVKSNIPTRISFAVSSSIDSRTILDMTGAEKLLGKGDMLYKPMDDNNPTRVQGSFVGDDEIKRVVDFIKERSHAPRYSDKFQNLDAPATSGGSSGGSSSSGSDDKIDVLYDEILEYAIRMGQISASLIQRKYSIGYNRAARIMDSFEEKGIVGPAKGSKPRDVLVKLEDTNKEE